MPENDVEATLARYPDHLREQLRPTAEVAARLVGQSYDEARAMGEAAGLSVTTMDADSPSATTMELMPQRITLWLRSNVVVKVEIG